MIELFGLPTCDRCRRARAVLGDRGVEHRFHDLRALPDLPARLAAWSRQVDPAALLNRRSRTWRSLPESARDVETPAAVIRLLAKHPALIRRPVVVAGERLEIAPPTDLLGSLAATQTP
jgi:arsenate reductase-like glutaredoxin family protein